MELKLSVMGSGGVGKTCITIQFVRGVFVDNYNPTIEDSFRKIVEVDGCHYHLTILDTAGSQQFTGIRDLYMKDGHGFLFVYAVNSVASFNHMPEFFERLYTVKEKNEGVPVVLIANKIDLPPNERTVTEEEGRALASKFNSSYLESSAKTKQNIQESFIFLIKQITDTTPKPRRRRNCVLF